MPTLTKREYEVLHLLSVGRQNKEIATELNITNSTVEKHLTNAYRKVGAENRTEAVIWMVGKSTIATATTAT